MKKLNLGILAISILLIAGSLLVYLIYDINKTEKSLAQSLVEKPMQSAKMNLEGLFTPFKNSLLSTKEQAQLGLFDSVTPKLMNVYFASLINNYPQLSSMGIANTEGYEYDVLPKGSGYDNRVVWIDKWGQQEKWSHWELDHASGKTTKTKEWTDKVKNDPRSRPWFTAAMNLTENEISWTQPYVYNTTFEVGMTASVKWNRFGNEKTEILAFDLTLSDVSEFTQQFSVSPNGKIFVLSSEGKYIGLPADELFKDEASIQKAILSHVDSIRIPVISDAYDHWLKSKRDNANLFEYTSSGENWWGKLIEFELSKGNNLIIGVAIPESDILSEVQRTKSIIIGSFVFLLILTGFVLYSYGQSKIVNRILASKNSEINEQRILIQEKSDEILDSINYAKRIQSAILPPIKEFKEFLPNSFILYKPKAIVAGDFYWLETINDTILFAAADCTGHGVPGAMVSVVCKNALSRAVREYNERAPGSILDRTREIVIEEFKKSEEEMKDGMDIALCALTGKTLEYSGAHNALWIIRKGAEEVEEISADKQPIGKFDASATFATHTVLLEPGDTFYLFSDGFADQFGGIQGKKFQTANFKKLLLSMQQSSMEEQKIQLDETFENWKGDLDQLDDVCVIGVRV